MYTQAVQRSPSRPALVTLRPIDYNLRAYPKSNFVLARASHAPTTTYPSDFTDRYLAIKTKAAYAVLEGGIFLDLRNF